TPPAITRSASPVATARAASTTACSPEPHKRFTVTPGISTGRPASSALMRATLRLSSPAWLAQPKMASSIRAGSAPVRRTISAITVAPRSSGRTSASAPPCRPTGVRTASTMKAERNAVLPMIAQYTGLAAALGSHLQGGHALDRLGQAGLVGAHGEADEAFARGAEPRRRRGDDARFGEQACREVGG